MKDIAIYLKKFGFSLISDFEVRILKEDDLDIDIIIPLDDRALDLQFDDMPNYIGNRIQCTMIKNLIIRLSKLSNNNLCTIHLLRSIDLHSSVINFEINYEDLEIHIKDLEHFVALRTIRSK